MGFLEDTKTIDPINPSKGGFLDNTTPMSEREVKVRTSNIESSKYKLESERAMNLGSIIKGSPKAVKDLYAPLAKDTKRVFDSWAKHTWDTWEQTPQLMMQDVEALAKDMGDINKPRPDLKGNFWGSLMEAGRNSYHLVAAPGRFAMAVFAPISAAIGVVLEETQGQKLIDKTGTVIADTSGITDLKSFQKFAMEHPNAADAFNNIMNLAFLGSAGEANINPRAMLKEVKNFADTVVKPAKVVETPPPPPSAGAVAEVPKIKTPQERYQDYLDEQGYEPYTPNDKLPTIDMGKPAKDSLPTIQIGESLKVTKNQKGEYTYEPIKEAKPVSEPIVKDNVVEPTGKPTQEATFTTTPKTETGVKVTKQAKDIARSLDEEFDIKVSDEDLATYKTKEGFLEDQANKANSLIENDPQLGMDIAMGVKNAPRGLNNESVYATMKRVAMESGDTQTLINLSKSKVASRASVKGQEIKSLDLYENNATDPVKIIQYINKSYETNFQKKSKVNYTTAKEGTVKEIKMSIKKNAPTKASWEDFINNIKCNY